MLFRSAAAGPRGTDLGGFGGGLRARGSGAREHRLTGCAAWAHLPPGVWGLSGSGLEPTSSALADGHPTAEPPGKPHCNIFASVIVCPGDGEWRGLQIYKVWNASLNHVAIQCLLYLFIHIFPSSFF